MLSGLVMATTIKLVQIIKRGASCSSISSRPRPPPLCFQVDEVSGEAEGQEPEGSQYSAHAEIQAEIHFLLCFAGLGGSSSRTAPEPLQQVPPRHRASASWSGVALVQILILSSTLRAGNAECYLKVGGFILFFARSWKWLAVAL